MKKRAAFRPIVSAFTEGALPMWTPNSVIRHRVTGKALLVIHVYRNCTIVVDIENKDPLVTPMALLEREYTNWSRESEMENEDPVNYTKEWKYKPVYL